MNSAFLTDGYKTSHAPQYPEGTTEVISNFTPRSDKYAPAFCKDGVVVFGIQLMLIQLKEHFDKNFFKTEERHDPYFYEKPYRLEALKKSVMDEIKEEFSLYLNMDYDISHFEDLWDLGYLPIEVRALPEGDICPIRVPMLSIKNTKPEFFWITNYLETIISNLLWKPMTSATIAHGYRKVLKRWAEKTDKNNLVAVDFQGHDFSMRGLDSIDATISSGLGHLTSFMGTDSLPTIYGARKYYNAEGFVAGSVPATEHSVMCAGTKDDELGTFERLLKIFPTGILSIVSDTWDLWTVLTVYLPKLKQQILDRDGKLVIRPDSGDPVDIICGLNTTSTYLNEEEFDREVSEPEIKGVIELLWDVFGGTVNEQGYKVLDPHIGAIYGDSITIERAEEICRRLESKGFASTNIVLGVGSFTYQFNTRDTYGFAMKATHVTVNGEDRPIFKDPITDDGTKKSAKGLLRVRRTEGSHGKSKYFLEDELTREEVESDKNALQVIFKDGELLKETSLETIRQKLK